MTHRLTKAERARLEAAIRDAEQATSGEIVVCLQRQVKGEIMPAAQDFFVRQRLDQTRDRNGVLIFLAMKDRQAAILGDEGLHAKLPPDFWQATLERMTKCFQADDLLGGLELGIRDVGARLREYFPPRPDDQNELPDRIAEESGQ